MKFILVVTLTLICLTAEARQDSYTHEENIEETLDKIHDSVRRRFQYTEGNPKGEVFEYYTSNEDIRGDCDDFASAVYYELWKYGGNPTILIYESGRTRDWPNGYKHTIVCALDYCFDNNRKDIYPRRILDKKLNRTKFELIREGYLRLDKMEQMLSYELDLRYYNKDIGLLVANN